MMVPLLKDGVGLESQADLPKDGHLCISPTVAFGVASNAKLYALLSWDL